MNDVQQKNNVLSQAYTSLETEYMKLKSEQDVATQYQQQAGLAYDPLITSNAGGEMDMYLYNDPSIQYAAV